LLNPPEGKTRRLAGLVGRVLIFVAPANELERLGLNIEILRHQPTGSPRRVLISDDMNQNEVTFVGEIPRRFLTGQVDVDAAQAVVSVARNVKAVADAELLRYDRQR
jgi:hypothetical protein